MTPEVVAYCVSSLVGQLSLIKVDTKLVGVCRRCRHGCRRWRRTRSCGGLPATAVVGVEDDGSWLAGRWGRRLLRVVLIGLPDLQVPRRISASCSAGVLRSSAQV